MGTEAPSEAFLGASESKGFLGGQSSEPDSYYESNKQGLGLAQTGPISNQSKPINSTAQWTPGDSTPGGSPDVKRMSKYGTFAINAGSLTTNSNINTTTQPIRKVNDDYTPDYMSS